MTISRRDFLLAGSALSTLWLTGCGGGASAGGQPTAATAAAAGSCTAASVTNATGDSTYQIVFSDTAAFAHADIPLVLVPELQNRILGCTNQIVVGTEGPYQEMFVSFVQTLTAAQTCTDALIRTLRLHLSIPHDSSSTIVSGTTFNFAADSTNPAPGANLFSGELIVTAPGVADGQNCAAYEITGGSIKVIDFNLAGTITLQLANVVATAAAAGSGNNAAYAPAGRVQMDGELLIAYEPLITVV